MNYIKTGRKGLRKLFRPDLFLSCFFGFGVGEHFKAERPPAHHHGFTVPVSSVTLFMPLSSKNLFMPSLILTGA